MTNTARFRGFVHSFTRLITEVGDDEQLQLGSSEKFWTLIEERRRQKTISRREL